MARTLKKRASKKPYISPSQLTLMSFETPFSEHLDASNRWVRLANEKPWDSIVNVYLNQLNNHATAAPSENNKDEYDPGDRNPIEGKFGKGR